MESLFMEFLNSRWSVSNGPHTDPLHDPEWVKEFIQRWHLPAQSSISAKQSQELMTLRSLLEQAVTAIAGSTGLSRNTIQQVNRYLLSSPLHYTLEQGDYGIAAVLKPVLTGWNGVLHGIALSFAEFLSLHDPGRLRECHNPECRWVFYDETKNASRKWCGNTCASLVKVRRFRERRRSEAEK